MGEKGRIQDCIDLAAEVGENIVTEVRENQTVKKAAGALNALRHSLGELSFEKVRNQAPQTLYLIGATALTFASALRKDLTGGIGGNHQPKTKRYKFRK